MGKEKPYVICMIEAEPSKRFALDRGYQIIPDNFVDYKSCKIVDIVQVVNMVGLAYHKPQWVHELEMKHNDIKWIVFWFNYYD